MERSSHHHVYMVRCRDGSLYTGYTVDVEARLRAHNEGRGAKYTRSRRPVELVAWAELPSKHDALSVEAHLKHLSHGEKATLVSRFSRDAEGFSAWLMARWCPEGPEGHTGP